MESIKCVLSVIVLLCCLVSDGMARPDPTVEELDGLLEEAARIESAVPDYNCDCLVRLNAETQKTEWFCTSSSDFECQSVSLEEMQDVVQTQEETEEWSNKRMKLLAQDMTSTETQCVCSVKINKEDGSIQYYCNGLSCYMLAAEVSSRRKTATTAGWQPRSCRKNPSDPCCRCRGKHAVCSDAHCHVLPCPKDEQISVAGKCCPECKHDTPALSQSSDDQSAHHQSTHKEHLVWTAKSNEPSKVSQSAKQTSAQSTHDQSTDKQSAGEDRHAWIAKSSNHEEPAKVQEHGAKEQTSEPYACTGIVRDPCCKCVHGMKLCMEPDEICPRLPCSNPVRVYGQCCPVCPYTEEDMSSQPAKASASGSSCPYYPESTAVVNAFSQCGCSTRCLSQKQDECEARASSAGH